jgi:omega-amidase
MRIALISLDQKWLDKEKNILNCKKITNEIANDDCDLIIFPEMTLTGFSPETESIIEDVSNSETLKWFGALSKKNGINIIFGACLKEKTDRQPFNMLCLADRDGDVKPLYSKIHLFSYANEDKCLAPGKEIITHKIDDIRFGLAICYDLRFPELFSIMANDCEAMIVIANWPAARADHWNTLLKARAIENECVVLGVNRVGNDGNGIVYEKGSIVITPDGSTKKPINSSLLFDIYHIEKQQINKYRNNFPTIQDKRFSLYKRYL